MDTNSSFLRFLTERLLLIAVLLLIFGYLTNGIYKREQQIEELRSVLNETNSKIEYYKNEHGLLVAQKAAAELRASELKAMYPDIYNSISKDLNIKVKDLKAYIESSFKATSSGTGSITNNYYQTAYGKKHYSVFSASDGFLNIRAELVDSLHTPYSYTYTDTVKQSISVKKRWFLGNDKLYGSATMANPKAIITGSSNILITQYRDKRWALTVGLMYDPFSRQVVPGIGIGYNLIKF